MLMSGNDSPAVDGDGPGEAGLLLVGEGVLHQPEDAVGGAGHQPRVLRPGHAHRPLVVGKVGQVNFLSSLSNITLV